MIPADALSAVVAIAAALGHPGATVTRRPLADVLRALGACGESIAWAEGYSAAWTTALAACSERSWLTWLYGRLLARGLVRREPLVIAACLCAREVMHLVPAGEERPLRAIETAEAWCRGEATLDEVRAARRGAWDAAYAAAAAAYAADAAAYAADAAADAADDAAYATDAADAAADAAYAADDAAYATDAAYAADAAAYATDAAAYATDAAAAAADAAAPERILAILRRELGPHLLAGLAGVEVGS